MVQRYIAAALVSASGVADLLLKDRFQYIYSCIFTLSRRRSRRREEIKVPRPEALTMRSTAEG
jgi:hypothetical protein